MRFLTPLFALILFSVPLRAGAVETVTPTDSDEVLFEKIFKKKRPDAPVEVLMPIFYENNSTPLGQIKTLAGKGTQSLRLDADVLNNYLKSLVENPQPFLPMVISGSKLQTKEATQWVQISDFQTSGYRLLYDDKKLELRIHVPPELRKIRGVSLTKAEYTDEEKEKPNINPSFFSSYLNVNSSQDYMSGEFGGRAPLRAQLENGTNIGGVVLESSASFTENKHNLNDYHSWIRGDLRAVHDSPSIRLRQTVGDLNYPVRGFQSFTSMGGASVVSHFGLEPSKLTVPTGNQDVFLKRPSKVTVFINERMVKEMDLPAGRHNFRDFPYISGPNDLRIEIVDDVGRTETIHLSYFSNTELLEPGLHQIAYAVGAPSSQSNAVRTYQTSKMTASAFHRYGVNEFLTLGANFQGNSTVMMAGAESILSTSLGAFKFEPAISLFQSVKPHYAFRARYIYLDYKGERRSQRSFSLGVETRTAHFTSLLDTLQFNPVLHDISALYSQTLSEKTTGHLSVGYQVNRKTQFVQNDGYRVTLGMSRGWKDGLSTNVNVQLNQNGRGATEGSLAFFLSWNLTKERQVVTASYDMKEDSTRVGWSYTPASRSGGTNARLGIKKQRRERGFDGQLVYTGSRGTISLNDTTTWKADEETGISLASLQVGTALVFAGGNMALTRPVTDSFVIVAPKKRLKGEVLELNPDHNGSCTAATDWLGATAISDLSSYNLSPLVIGTDRLRQGLSVDQDHYSLFPTYKSGYAIELGTDAHLSLAMNLLNPDGTPIAMQPGKLVSLENSAVEPLTVFTGRTGKMRADGLKAGKYQLELFEGTWEPLVVEIPESADILYDLGKVTMKLRK